MKAVLVIEHRFKRDLSGRIFSSSNSVSTLLWERYLNLFSELTVLARVQNVNEILSEEYLVSTPKVNFKAIPFYIGPIQFLKNYKKIVKTIKAQVETNTAYVCRLPSISGTILISELKKQNLPYVVEVVGDPWEVFAPGALKNTLSFVHRYRSYKNLKNNVNGASGVIYVTEKTLQRRYPANKNAVSVSASNVVLKKGMIANGYQVYPKKIDCLKLLSIGSLDQMYKSPDIVLKTLGELRNKGVDFHLTWLGGGKYLKAMQDLAKTLNIQDKIHFKGHVVSSKVLEELRSTHLYIHVSRTEGLPRAIIEAMALGLPCIGTKVGGIPELLNEACLIEKNDINALIERIEYCKENPKFMSEMAKENLLTANKFEFNLLESKRYSVYVHLKKLLE